MHSRDLNSLHAKYSRSSSTAPRCTGLIYGCVQISGWSCLLTVMMADEGAVCCHAVEWVTEHHRQGHTQVLVLLGLCSI